MSKISMIDRLRHDVTDKDFSFLSDFVNLHVLQDVTSVMHCLVTDN